MENAVMLESTYKETRGFLRMTYWWEIIHHCDSPTIVR